MMNTSANAIQQHAAGKGIPKTKALSQISLPTRDVVQSKRFFTDVLGGELREDGSTVKVQFTNFSVELGAQAGGATAPHREHPHYAFTVPAEVFALLKQRLESFGVPTHEPWTRTGSTQSLMYFRDPSGNQFEMFCAHGDVGLPLRIGHRAGGDYVIPFPSLVYREVKDPTTAPPKIPPLGFSHMTLPSKDLQQSKRFLTEVFGGDVTIDHPSHVTVVVGGTEIGSGNQPDGGWTESDAEYPHYTLSVAPEDLVPLQERLEHYGVPTSEIFTHNGTDAAIYYRDPTGNLWELCCERGFAARLRRTPSAGGDYVPDVKALCYDRWNDPGR
jgi:catechol 2,3-dioxygenase-like lactoylglutathione lyase family enzyme